MGLCFLTSLQKTAYFSKVKKKSDSISRRVPLLESPSVSRVGGMRRKPLKFSFVVQVKIHEFASMRQQQKD